VLSGLAVSASLTALFAGVAGAWSPCGFSMVETVGSAMGAERRGVTRAASATFALGTLLGGALTFGSLALLGSLAGHGVAGLREALGAALALAAAIADWRGVRIAPQIRRQVPERWRWIMPLPLACALYGVLLGLGFTTFVLAFAVWALAGISFAAGDPLLGLAVGVCFGAGRALPVLWVASALRTGTGEWALDRMAREPRLWLGLRRLDALGLGLCALALMGASAGAAPLPGASDPSAASDALAWQQLGAGGFLSQRGGAPIALPGSHPALGETTVAWATATQITVATRPSLQPKLVLVASGVNALAVSDAWIVYRDQDPQGEHLIAVSLADPSERRYLAGSRLAGEVGRPALAGTSAVFAIGTPARSTIELVDLVSGRRRTLRAASRDVAFSNPTLLDGRLLFERATRCLQQLRLGALIRHRRERVLLTLPSTVSRDPGYQAGYTHAYNSASRCPNRRAGRGGARLLGATALDATSAYVTELGPAPGDAEVLAVKRSAPRRRAGASR
jgi:hypothetical protein